MIFFESLVYYLGSFENGIFLKWPKHIFDFTGGEASLQDAFIFLLLIGSYCDDDTDP